ncbi:hypothetical protein JCM14469_08620 [Desulfatiferula olefinivorans]
MPGQRFYRLCFPNKEVRTSLNAYLLNSLSNVKGQTGSYRIDLIKALQEGKPDQLYNALFGLFSSIPFDWYGNNNLDKYEGYYASVTYACLVSLGFDVVCEDTTNRGRIDLTLFAEDKIYIIEFKVVEHINDKTKALDQIKARKYHEKYRNKACDIYRIGMDFSKEERNLTRFEWDLIKK